MLLKRGRKKASEFVLLRKKIKQFPLHHGMEDLIGMKLYNVLKKIK